MGEAEAKIRDAIIEYASAVYGVSWRHQVAEKMGISRRTLSYWFDSGRPIPQNISLFVLRAMENRVTEQRAEFDEISERITEMRKAVGSSDSISARRRDEESARLQDNAPRKPIRTLSSRKGRRLRLIEPNQAS